ncbi:MAG: hypothetical protein EA353_00300 [Puniceicoccaceae bacterium]|nr:MAG: hypothetical protein EA353_00300 [Puniceicoccaceae bacterium]
MILKAASSTLEAAFWVEGVRLPGHAVFFHSSYEGRQLKQPILGEHPAYLRPPPIIAHSGCKNLPQFTYTETR